MANQPETQQSAPETVNVGMAAAKLAELATDSGNPAWADLLMGLNQCVRDQKTGTLVIEMELGNIKSITARQWTEEKKEY